MGVTYERVNWEDSPSTQTPLNADNLNNMDAGIADLADEVNNVTSAMQTVSSDITDLKADFNENTKIITPTKISRTAVSVGTTVPINNGTYATVITTATVASYWLDCKPGDKYKITGEGSASSIRLYAFVGAFGETNAPVITASLYTSFNEKIITAPDNAEHLIIQLYADRPYAVSKIEPTFLKIADSFYEALFLTTKGLKTPISVEWAQGNVNPNGSTPTGASETNRCLSTIIPIKDSGLNKLYIDVPNTMDFRLTCWQDYTAGASNLIASPLNSSWQTVSMLVDIPENTAICVVSVRYKTNGAISPTEANAVNVYAIIGDVLVNQYSDKKISILGDSISTFAGVGASSHSDGHMISDGEYTYPGNHCRYPTNAVTNVFDTYWMKFINAFGMVLGINDSWAGSCVSWDGTEGTDKGQDVYIASQTRIEHLGENGTPDFILVNAGTNDIGKSVSIGTFNTDSPVAYTAEEIANLPVATFADAYRAMLIRLQKTYPLAQVIVMLPNYTTSYYNPEKADQYLEIIKEACDYFGVKWIDMRTTGITMFNASTYLSDGIHPNVAGMNLLYERLYTGVKY